MVLGICPGELRGRRAPYQCPSAGSCLRWSSGETSFSAAMDMLVPDKRGIVLSLLVLGFQTKSYYRLPPLSESVSVCDLVGDL